MKAPFAGRDNDSVGLALTYIKVGNHVNGLDQDIRAFTGGPYGVRTSETALEATYQYQVNAVVATASRRAIHVQRRRRPESERSDAAAAQHVRHRRADQHHFLMPFAPNPYATTTEIPCFRS